MHFTVVGAGAIGGTTGAYLLRGGHPVLFVDRDHAHVDAINRSGLTIDGRETFTVRAPAVTPERLATAVPGGVPEAVLVCVKAMHTTAAIDALSPVLGEASFVVSFQNGLNEKVIAARIGAQRTVGAFVNFGADYLEPGRVLYGGTGALYLGELDGSLSPRLLQLEQIFRACFLPHTQATTNIWGYLWGKLGYASLLFATALVDASIADVLDHPPSRPALANLAAEVVRVAEAEDIRCEGFDGYAPHVFAFRRHRPRDWTGIGASLDRLVVFNRASLKQKKGIWRDLVVRKRKTEVDQHVGAVVDTARRYHIKVPLNQRLLEIIHDLEEGRRQMSWDNLTELTSLNQSVYPDDAVVGAP
jgi:2-dehydropantoate 2-reductase